MFRGDANGTVHWNAGTREECGQEVALIAFRIRQENSRLDRATALARDDEGKVLPGVLVPVLKAGAPHHDAVVEQRPVSFAKAMHLFHHVSELSDVEGGNRRNLP